MIIIGYENCKTCHDFHDKHDDLLYIELKRKSGNESGLRIKKFLTKNHVDLFPVLMNDRLDKIESIKEFDPGFWKDHQKLI